MSARTFIILFLFILSQMKLSAQPKSKPSVKLTELGIEAYLESNALKYANHSLAEPFVQLMLKNYPKTKYLALGESAFGSGSEQQFRIEVAKKLIKDQKFGIIALEASFTETIPLNDFIRTNIGDPQRVVSGLGYWNWDTEEMLEFVLWLRDHNRSLPMAERVRVIGVDSQFYLHSLKIGFSYLERVDPGRATMLRQPVDSLLKKDIETLKNLQFKLTDGERRTLTSYLDQLIKVIDQQKLKYVERSSLDDWLMARQHLVSAGQSLRSFITESAKWSSLGATEERLLMARIGNSAERIKLILTLQNPELIPQFTPLLSFASGGYTAMATYKDELTSTEQMSYQNSLSALREVLADHKKTLRKAKKSDIEELYALFEDLVLCYKVFEEQKKKPNHWPNEREIAMADNLKWIIHSYPDKKMLIWMHNKHLARAKDTSNNGSVGYELKNQLGEEFIGVAQVFGSGTFLSLKHPAPVKGSGVSRLQVFSVQDNPEHSLEKLMGSKFSNAIVPLKQVSFIEEKSTSFIYRSLGGSYSPEAHSSYFDSIVPSSAFDLYLFRSQSTASTPSATLKRIYEPD